MFGFIKKAIFTGLTILSTLTSVDSLSATPFKCVSMSDEECRVRPEIVNVNSDEPAF